MIETSMEGDGVTALAWSPDGSQLAAGNSTGRLQIFHLIQRFGCKREFLKIIFISATKKGRRNSSSRPVQKKKSYIKP